MPVFFLLSAPYVAVEGDPEYIPGKTKLMSRQISTVMDVSASGALMNLAMYGKAGNSSIQ